MKKENLKLEIFQWKNWEIEVNFDKNDEIFWLFQKTNSRNIWNNEVLNLIKSFANTWFNLENFDKWNLPEKWITKKEFKIEIKKLYQNIEVLKQDLIKKWLATEMFAWEKNKWNLEWIFGNIFASFDRFVLFGFCKKLDLNFEKL